MVNETLVVESLPPRPRSRHGFRIAIICALALEAEMVEMVLDHDWNESGARYGKAPGDKNTYTTGVISRHNVVLAYMPSMGGIDAASVAAGLRSSFPKIEFAFVVGICGAVPTDPKTKQDIFLGDCIVSTSVVQYDFGAQYPAGFKKKEGFDSLGRASQEVRSLIVKLNTRRNQGQLTKRLGVHLKDLLRDYPEVTFPGTEGDRLFQSTYVHKHMNSGCDSCRKDVGICSKDCETIGCDPSFTIRRKRSSLDPHIHFGRFGSANTVMKSGEHRDEIAAEDLIAFEMESAGVWDAFPTIVVKSACDYADSHKSKEWQPYAAASAAAGLKAVLEKLELSDEEISQDSQLPIRDSNQLNNTEMACLQSLCLQPSYQDMKDRTAERVAGTCNWVLSQATYTDWLERDGGKLLISADPGCGKSVLAKYLVDDELPRALPGSRVCYYFFKDQVQNKLAPAISAICHQLMVDDYYLLRKYAVPCYEKDKNMANNTGTLIDIIRNAVSDEKSPPIVVVLDALDECETEDCKRLMGMLEQLGGANKLKIVLTSRPYYGIVSDFEMVSSRLHIPGEEESDAISKEVEVVIKQRLEILCKRNRFDDRTRVELESRLLSQSHRTYLWVYLVFEELDVALKMTARELGVFFSNLPRSVNDAYERILSRHTRDSLARKTVYTTLSMLLAAYRPLTTGELQQAVKIGILPNAKGHVDLDLEPDGDFIVKLRNWCGLFIQVYNGKVTFIHQTAREFLTSNNASDVQLVKENRLWMGSCTIKKAHEVMARACIAYLLLCSKLFKEDKTQYDTFEWKFLDYTAQYWDWHYRDGIYTEDQELLRRISLLCSPEGSPELWLPFRDEWSELQGFCLEDMETRYKKSMEWPVYLMVVTCLETDVLMQSALANAYVEFKDVLKAGYWYMMLLAVKYSRHNHLETLLDFATHNDILVDFDELTEEAVKYEDSNCMGVLLEHGASANAKRYIDLFDKTLLIAAIYLENINSTKLLLQYGADLEATDFKGNSPLDWAIKYGSEDMTVLLLNYGANIHKIGHFGQTYLHKAVFYYSYGHATMLLDHGSNIEARDNVGNTPLHLAAWGGRDNIVALLLDRDAKVDAQNDDGLTPLTGATCARRLETVRELLKYHADINHQDSYGRSILHHAINPQLRGDGLIDRRPVYWSGSGLEYDCEDAEEVESEVERYLDQEFECGYKLIRLLLEHGARLDLQDKDGHTPLSLATHYKMKETVQLLREYEKESALPCIELNIPYICIQEHHSFLLQFLSNSDVNISIQHEKGDWFVHGLIRNSHGGAIFHAGCYIKSDQIIELLQDIRNKVSPQTGYLDITETIETYNIDVESRDVLGCSPLLSYSRLGCKWAVQCLLEHGFDTEYRDIYGGTSLHWASRRGSEEVLRLLLGHGADINASQDSGHTALTVAMLYNNFETFKFLLSHDAGLEIPDIHGRRILHHAVCLESSALVYTRHTAITFLSYILQTQHIDVDAQDHGGWTPLHWAAARNFDSAVIVLLKYGASTSVRDDRGCTPSDYAKLLGHNNVMDILTQHDSSTKSTSIG